MDHVHFEKGFFVCVHTCAQSLSNVQLFLAHGLQPTRLLYPWDSPGKITREGCHFLLQGIFLIQVLNLHLLCPLHCRGILYHFADRKPLSLFIMRIRRNIWADTCIKHLIIRPARVNKGKHPKGAG